MLKLNSPITAIALLSLSFPSIAEASSKRADPDSCVDAISQINSKGPSSISRYKRLRGIQPYLQSNNMQAYKDKIWASHDNSNSQPGNLAGFSTKRAKRLQKRMRANRNRHVPALYQLWDPDGKETFEVIDNLSALPDNQTEDFTKALAEARNWINEYTSYQKNLNAQIDKGFTIKGQLDDLRPHRKGGDQEWTFDDFAGPKRQTKILTEYVDGQATPNTADWNTWADFDGFARDLETEMDYIFARGFVDEFWVQSNLYDVMIDQAYMYRRLTFLRNRLDVIPNEKIAESPDQLALLEELQGLLKDASFYPRSDAIEYVQKRELRAELKAIYTRSSTKRKIQQSKDLKLIGTAKEKLSKGAQGSTLMLRMVAGTAALSGTAATVYFFLPNLKNNPYLLYPKEYITNKGRNLQFWANGTTDKIIECADNYRQILVYIGCWNELVWMHTSHIFLKSQIQGNFNYRQNEDFLRIRQELAQALIKTRAERGRQRFFEENQQFIKDSYAPATDEFFLLDIFDQYKIEPDSQVAGELKSIVDTHFAVGARSPELDAQFSSLRANGHSDLARDVELYLYGYREDMLSLIQKYGNAMDEEIEEVVKAAIAKGFDAGPPPREEDEGQ